MSNQLRYDSLLVRHLAHELDARLRGRACALVPLFAPDQSVTLPLEGGEALRLDLHAARGWVRLVPWEEEIGPEGGAVCLGVGAPADERRIRIGLRGGNRFRTLEREVVVELQTPWLNALLLDGENRILMTLRTGREGRAPQPGAAYQTSPAPTRIGTADTSRDAAREVWTDILGAVPPAERARALIGRFAYTGRLNAPPMLGDAAETEGAQALESAFGRWWELRSLEQPVPVLLALPFGPHPYPAPLPGLAATPVASLLEAMKTVAESSAAYPNAADADDRIERVRQRWRAAQRKAERIAAQLATAGEADRLRGYGDLLLAHLHNVPRGADEVTLPGWEGGFVQIPLDPALSPADNAAAWYDKARQRARAEERLPALLQQAEEEAERWRNAANAAEQGELPEWAARWLDEEAARGSANATAVSASTLPFRRYRTSGGLEVRVGRSARDNDRLTFGHSAPHDVWLHARSVPGSHVILRWPDPDAAPPARDLEEAAGLAALHSKARTSGLVAVDWARRKHVRKPRGAPPGAVIPQQVKTLFVEPNEELERRLRISDSSNSGTLG